jgi:hypothetical protein
MSKLQSLIDQLNDTNRVVGQIQDNANGELDAITRFNLSSIEMRRDTLTRQINDELAVTQNSMIQYRIVRESDGKYPAKAVGEALERFQDLLTSVYDALVYGPKRRFRPSIDSIEKTTLNFAGATAGSVKITLAAEDDRLLLGDTTLERALGLVEKTLSAQTTDDLSLLANEVGIASVSRAYEWSKSAAGYGLKTEISWGKTHKSDQVFEINSDDAARVSQLIERKSDDLITSHEYLCVLHGFDKKSSYFHIETLDEREDIKGDVGLNVSEVHTTGKRYRAYLKRAVITQYATGEDKVHWTLEQLSPIEETKSLIKI